MRDIHVGPKSDFRPLLPERCSAANVAQSINLDWEAQVRYAEVTRDRGAKCSRIAASEHRIGEQGVAIEPQSRAD
jgi:hypothetical protein